MALSSNPFTINVLPAAGGGTPAWRTGMAIGEWRQLANTRLDQVTGVLTVPGNTGRNSIVDTWNGTCCDRTNSRAFLLACGGHTDYAGNEVYKLDLSVDVPAWVLSLNTTPSGSITSNTNYYADGRPCSSHTYFSQVYVPEIGRAMRFGAGSRYGGVGGDGYKVDGFNPLTNTWDAAGTYPDIDSASVDQQSWSVARDPATGNVWITAKDATNSTAIFRWNRASNTMTRVNGTDFYGFDSCGDVDTTRNKALFCRASENLLIDLATNDTTSPSITNGGPGSQNGMFYAAAVDRYFYRGAAAGGTIRQIDPATLSSSAFTTTGGGSIPARSNGCYNAFEYLPNYGCAYYIPKYDANIWVVRLH